MKRDKNMAKERYQIRNWSDYNKALVNRGSVTFWFDEKAILSWHNADLSGSKGRPQQYSDVAIICALTLRAIFHLPLRATQGFISSLISMLTLPIMAPNFTTLCRRQKNLSIELPNTSQSGSIDIVIDATGLKVYGEGEWKVRQHGYDKRRTWRKLHLGVNPSSHIIEAAVVTTNDFKDSEVIDDLLDQVQTDINHVCGDGAYDSENCYSAIEKRGAKATIPPRRDAKIKRHGRLKFRPHQRDENLRACRQMGRAKWKQSSGYHKRSIAETSMFRVKTIFGGKLSARNFDNQSTEALIKCRALNMMTNMGMPVYRLI